MRFGGGAGVAPIRRLRRTGLRAVVSAGAAIAVALLATDPAFASAGQGEAGKQAPAGQDDPYGDFLANYVEWARSIEAEGQERGTPLTSNQIELASQLGIEHPEKVRLVFVDAVPFPTEDAKMRAIGETLGFIGPGVTNNAQAFGYTIWVRNGFTLDRPGLAHELVHVEQIERSSSFGGYVMQYMQELLEYGHADMPLELEAYEANARYAPDGMTSGGNAKAHEDRTD